MFRLSRRREAGERGVRGEVLSEGGRAGSEGPGGLEEVGEEVVEL